MPISLARAVKKKLLPSAERETTRFGVELINTKGICVFEGTLPVSLITLDARNLVPMWDAASVSRFLDTVSKTTDEDSYWIVCFVRPEHTGLFFSGFENLESRSKVYLGVYEDEWLPGTSTGIIEPDAIIIATKIHPAGSVVTEQLDMRFIAKHPRKVPEFPAFKEEEEGEKESMASKLLRRKFKYGWQGLEGDSIVKNQLGSATASYLVEKLARPDTAVFDFFSGGAIGRAALCHGRVTSVFEHDPKVQKALEGILGRIDTLLNPVKEVEPIAVVHPEPQLLAIDQGGAKDTEETKEETVDLSKLQNLDFDKEDMSAFV